MKLFKKILIALLLPIFLFIGAAGVISNYFAYKALIEHSNEWLEIRLSEAVLVVKKHENILHKYELQNIPASITKAKLDALAELTSADIGEHGYIFVADHQGVVISHPDKYYIGTDAGVENWFKQLTEKKGKINLTIKNKQHLAAHEFFKPWDWHLIAVESKKNIVRSIQKIKTTLLFLSIGAFIVIFCFIYFFTRRLVKPLGLIADGARQVATGKYDTQVPIQSKDEFAELAHTFNHMAKHYQDKLNLLKKEHAYYYTLCHNTTDLITITDHHGQFVFVSPSAKRIIGYAPDELFGKKVLDFLDPLQKDQLVEHFRLTTLSEVASPPAEFSFRHKDGHLCILESISKNLLSHPDIKGFVTASRNINRRKLEQNALKNAHQKMEQQLDEKNKEVTLLHRRLDDEAELQKTQQANLEKTSRAAATSLINFSTKISNDLCPVTGFSQLLPITIQDKEIQTYLNTINKAGHRILQTARNMTIFSDVSSRTLQLKKRGINIHHLLDDLSQRCKDRIIEKPILFISDLDTLLPNCLLLDKIYFQQILFNLMGHTIRNTSSGHIKLTSRFTRLSKTGTHIDLKISIETAGIALGNTSGFNTEGNPVDMDLFICRHLIQLMGGRLDIEKFKNQGMVFSFYLPKIKIGEDLDDIDQTTAIDIKKDRFKGSTGLIADESGSVSLMLSHVLTYVGIKPLTADTGTQLISQAREGAPRIIFLSTKLLDMNGINTLSMLKKNTTTKNIPVILMSTHGNDLTLIPKNSVGDGFLLKPIDIQALFYQLHKHLTKVSNISRPAPNAVALSIEPIKQRCSENNAFKENLNRGIVNCFPDFKEGINMAGINTFISRIIQLGEDFKLIELTKFGEKLSRDAQVFDIKKLEAGLSHLSCILNSIDLD